MARATRPSFAAVICLAVAACGTAQKQEPNEENVPASAPSASALEQTALEAGVVADARRISPVGLYRKRHEAGRDSLCIVPDGEKKMRFAMQVVFGESEQCDGRGSVRAVGDKLIFHFARSTCLIVAGYEGDRISLPGALDVKCAHQCTDRATLDGVSFPRVSQETGSPYAERDRDGELLCPKE